tara:strand:- start:587 stop:1537 length:951 start_codon:yes stop_codon:yes gene_type:complete
MKIAFNKKIVDGPWGGGNQMALLLKSYFIRRDYEVTFSLQDNPDIVVVWDVKDSSCSFSMDELHSYKIKSGCRVVHRVNDNGSHRGSNTGHRSDKRMMDINKLLADETIFISKWLKDYYEDRGLVVSGANIIPNGTDRGRFFPTEFVRRKETEPIRVFTHHWSNNMAKGYETYRQLNDFCIKNPSVASFTFMGNRPPGYLDNASYIKPQPYIEIPKYLQQHDAYITATQFESGGCHIIEGMACGLIPIVRKGGGGVEEYAKGYASYYDSPEQVFETLIKMRNDYSHYIGLANNIRDNYTYGTKEMCKDYLDIIIGK